MRSVNKKFGNAEAFDRIRIRCPNCSWETYRIFNNLQDAFGHCKHCNTEMLRWSSVNESKRLAKAKRELAELNGY